MQPTSNHQMMGYDRSSTMFSPDGRLLQVEYAKKAVRQSATSLGMVCKDGVLLLADKRIIEKSQVIAQQYRVTYDNSIDVLSLVKDVANMKQAYTQFGGARPFGVSIIFAGVDDDGPKLYVTDVTGIYFQYRATAIGEAETQLKEILEKEYKDGLTIEEGIKLALGAMKKVF